MVIFLMTYYQWTLSLVAMDLTSLLFYIDGTSHFMCAYVLCFYFTCIAGSFVGVVYT